INDAIYSPTPSEISSWIKNAKQAINNLNAKIYLLSEINMLSQSLFINGSPAPNTIIKSSLKDILQTEGVPEKFYLSVQACKGILRRKDEKGIKMNPKLEKLMALSCYEEL